MSKAFTREDVDLPERSGRKRSASGLPPGATNYMTRRGAARLKAELLELRQSGTNSDRRKELEDSLNSVTVIDSPEIASDSVTFGARVMVEDADGKLESYQIVGVDELAFGADTVSWVSPTGKNLLGAEVGQRVNIGEDKSRTVRIIKVEYPLS